MADDPVDHRRGHLDVPEHRAPPAELQVRGDDHRLPLVGVGEHLGEQARRRAPALRTEIVSCSTPKLHRAQTRKPEVDKHSLGPAARRNVPTAPPRALR